MPARQDTAISMWAGLWAAGFLIVLTWSVIGAADYPTWVLEALPAVAGFVILTFTRRRFPLTTLCYVLILLHCWVLLVGAHYTYAEVPLFDTIRDIFGQSRNNFDKLGHFMQGFVPAIICREIIIRFNIISSRFFTHFFTVCFCLALSALYELLEWWVALLSEEAADAFLGTQGYVWDTQSDIAWALFGALCALLALGHYHDTQITRIQSRSAQR